jgi:DNA-binding NtrC family response regulator
VTEVLFLEAEPFSLEQYLPESVFVRRSACDDLASVDRRCASLVVISLPQEFGRASHLLQTITADVRPAPIFILVPHHSSDLMQPLLKCVEDFALVPAAECELRERFARLLAGQSQQAPTVFERLHAEQALRQLVGEHPRFAATLQQIPRLAQSDATLLIQGASGTGKELVARAVHHLSRRRSMSFIAVDCGAFPDHLIENELFGHAPGAYTDARQSQKGLAALAAGGTLFLDEIDALSLPAQAKLLRFVQERTFKPLGSDRFEKVDIKIIAATNRDLAGCVAEGRFRSDLFYRLNVLTLKLVPLSERRSDIMPLTHHFLRTLDPRGVGCSSAAMRALIEYDWPGNIRELQNVIQRALVICDGPQVQVQHLSLVSSIASDSDDTIGRFKSARATALAAFERRYLGELLRKHSGNITRAARDAGKDRRALGRLIKKHGLDRHSGSV